MVHRQRHSILTAPTLTELVLLSGAVFGMRCTCALAQDSVSINLSAALARSCAISNGVTTVNLGELSKPGSASISVGFSCNTTFSYSFTSLNGALSRGARFSASPFFTALVPYTLSYQIGTDKGYLIDACLSKNMLEGASTCSGSSVPNAAAIEQNITIRVSWDLIGQYPEAGAYRDILSLRIQTKM